MMKTLLANIGKSISAFLANLSGAVVAVIILLVLCVFLTFKNNRLEADISETKSVIVNLQQTNESLTKQLTQGKKIDSLTDKTSQKIKETELKKQSETNSIVRDIQSYQSPSLEGNIDANTKDILDQRLPDDFNSMLQRAYDSNRTKSSSNNP